MLRGLRFLPFSAAVVVAAVLPVSVRADGDRSGGITEVALPGGLRAALGVIDDRVSPDRSHFLPEVIRRTYQTSVGAKHEDREARLRALVTHLESAALAIPTDPNAVETLPLPLSPSVWIDVVFGGRSSPKTLVADILRARAPSLLYYALLALDDDTRAWLATKPDLLRELATVHSAGFVVAAPGLRVAGGAVRPPGGELARPAWEAVVDRPVTDPAEFVRALVRESDRRLPYFLAAMAQLTPAQIGYALNLNAPDVEARIDAMRRMQTGFERFAPGWTLEERPFWRPANDPALLLAELTTDATGRPVLPGTKRFWSAAFADGDGKWAREEDAREIVDGEPVSFGWLCEQIFGGDQRRRYPLVLFASRVVGQITAANAVDAVDAVRAVARYPALIATLERASIRDVRIFAAAARHASRLSAIEDNDRAARVLAQFQGALAIVTRAALKGSVRLDAAPGLVSSLLAVDITPRGEYEGRMVRWLVALLQQTASATEPEEVTAGPVEAALLGLLAGAQASESQLVDWEGTRYRIDLRHAESRRLARLLGEETRPYLSSARRLVDAADVLDAPGLTRERLTRELAALELIAEAVGGESGASLRRSLQDADVRGASRVASALRVVADALCAQGLLEFTYATALGNPDRTAVTAGDAAGRHDFGLGLGALRKVVPWRLPAAGNALDRGWSVTGSLLGLDVRLAEFSLVAVSSKPPIRRPSIPDEDRRVFIEAVGLVEPATLTDQDRETIVTTIQTGRAKLAAVNTAADSAAVAEHIRLGAVPRSLLTWAAAHDRDSLPRFLSHGELFALGSASAPVHRPLHAWGAAAEPRLGCLCLQLFNRRSWDSLEGRWNSGILASGFADLNLRLAELLGELRMPAAVLPGVLGAATLDFVNTANCRDSDDRRGLMDYVQRLTPDRVELYLALLTSDGPLVPLAAGSAAVAR